MKKTLKAICGMSLVLALGVLSFLVIDGNESVEAADAVSQVIINYGEDCNCEWKNNELFDFGSLSTSTTNTDKEATGLVQHFYTNNNKVTCGVSATALTKSGSAGVTIPANQIQLKAANLTRLAGDLNTGSSQSAYASAATAVTIFAKDAGKVGSGTQVVTLKLTVPAYTLPGTYNGAVKITAPSNCSAK